MQGGAVVLENTAAAHLSADVQYGGMTALIAQLVAPSQGGNYALRWDMYRDGVGWFADQPAPGGRSQPLDVAVQVTQSMTTQTPTRVVPQAHAQFIPPAVQSGEPVTYYLSVRGPTGSAFESQTFLPKGIVYSPNGSADFQTRQLPWAGVFGVEPDHVAFGLSVSEAVTAPSVLPLTTTLAVSDFATLNLTAPLIVNGKIWFFPWLSGSFPPTPTPTPTPTPSPTPTPTPSATPTPPLSCSNLVVNGSFETQEAWTINDTTYPAGYSTEQVYDGARSMRLGIPPGGANTYSYSSIDQTLAIPANATSVTLNYWSYARSDDLTGDWFDVLVNDGVNWNYTFEERSDAQSWQPHSQDLSTFVGENITLRFRVYNDGAGGHTVTWLDQVNLWVCVP
jgi:hypothetical protein